MRLSIILAAVSLLTATLADGGVKTARHAYSSGASGSNSFASSFNSGGAGTFDAGIKIGDVGFGEIPENAAFWWAKADSPFKQAYEYYRRCALNGICDNIPGPFHFAGLPGSLPNNLPENGCSANGCSFSGGFNVHDKGQGGKDVSFGPIDISKNPFLNGEYQGVAISGCSGNACPGGKPQTTIQTTHCKGSDCKTNTQHGGSAGEIDLSGNPFLSGGAFASSGSFGGAGCSGAKGGCSGNKFTTGQIGIFGQGPGCSGTTGCAGSGSTSGSGSYSGNVGYTTGSGTVGGSGCSGATGGCSTGVGSQGPTGAFPHGGFGIGGPGCSSATGCAGSGSISGAGSYSGSTGFTSGQGTVGGSGCSGKKGGCSTGFGTSGTKVTGGFFGTVTNQQGIPTSKPGYTGGSQTTSGSFSGSVTGQQGTQGSHPGQPGYTSGSQSIPTARPGQPGYTSSQTTSGSFSGSVTGQQGTQGSHPGQPGYTSGSQPIPTAHPGQPGYPSSQTTSGSFSGSVTGQGTQGSHPGQPGYTSGSQPIPTARPGQPGYTSSQTTSGSFSGSVTGQQGTQGSHPGQPGYTSGSQPIPTGHPGQPGYTSSQTTSGSFSGSVTGQGAQGSHPGQPGYTSGSQPIPTAHPGQSSYTGSQSTSGSFTGSVTGQQGIPSSHPGQPGYSGGVQPISTAFPGSQATSGSFGQTGYTSGSHPTSGSFSGSVTGQHGIPSSQQGQPSYTSGPQAIPTARPGQPGYTGSQSTSGSFSGVQPGNVQPGQFKQPGSTPIHGQPSYTGSQATTGSSFSGSFGTTGGKTGQPSYPGDSHTAPSSSTGSSSFSGTTSGAFGQSGSKYPFPTSQPGQPGYTSSISGGSTSGSKSGQYPQATSQPGQPSYTSGTHTTSGSVSGSTSGSFGTSGSKTGQYPAPTSHPGPGQPAYTSGNQDTHSTSGSLSGSTSSFDQNGYTGGSHFGQTTSGSFGGSTSGSFSTSGSYSGSGSTSFIGSPFDRTHPSTTGISGQLTIKCSGQGLLCVKKHLCTNGIVNKNGEGILQVRDGDNYCEVNTETCCRLPGTSGEPHKDIHLQIPSVTGGQTTYTTNSHKSSSTSSSTLSGSSIFQSHRPSPTSPSDFSSQFPSSGKAPAPGSDVYQPGKTIPFGGKDGTSPGFIHIVPDGQPGSGIQAPGLIRPGQNGPSTSPGLSHYGPGQSSSTPGSGLTHIRPGDSATSPSGGPGLTHIRPGGQSTPKPFSIHVYPNGEGLSNNPGGIQDGRNELNFASTVKGPAYLPPGPSPSPSPSAYSPDLLPPPSKPSTNYIPPKYSPTTPRPNTYYQPSQTTTPAYLPPVADTRTSSVFIQTTRKPPPNQIPVESNENNKYLPPEINFIPDNTNPRITVVKLPTERSDFPQNTTPYPGCAAALKCVQYEFCTAEGVISPTRVSLTREQENNRVPLTECLDPETGIIGKCCRDPDYKDPWPSTQLGLFNPDQQGAGSNVPGVKGDRPKVPRPRPNEPNQIGSPSNPPNSVVGYPVHVPNIPFDSLQGNTPLQVDVRPPTTKYEANQKYPISASKISTETCGVRHTNSKPAGPGSIDAGFAEIPWQAMILRDSNRSLLCGGAIIRRDVVLTAAHCVENLQANDVLVKGGEWKLGIDEEPKPFQINKVAAIVRHPGYRPENKLNDVALLILNEKFRLDRNVDTLCLPPPDLDVAKTFQKAKCITTGWGKTILQLNIVNSIMHILGVGVIPSSKCQQQLQQYHSDSAYLYNTNCVCGAPVQPEADICDVDVGSALACDRGDGKYTLAGIYSWDTGCNPTAQIAGYSKVDTQWIESTLQRPLNDLKTEERGFYAQLQGQECHCIPGK